MPRLLFLTSHLPYPPVSGGRRREYELIRRLRSHHAIHLIAVSKTLAEDRDYVDVMRRYCRAVDVFPAAEQPRAVDSQESETLPSISRNNSPDARCRVAELLDAGAIDIIHAEGYYMLGLVPARVSTPILLTEQNLEHLLELQRARLAPSHLLRLNHLRRAARTLQGCRAAWRRASLCALVTESDRQELLRHAPDVRTVVVPDGSDHNPDVVLACGDIAPHVRLDPSRPIVLYVGNFAYEPNADAAHVLCHDIAPRLFARVPTAQIVLVGNPDPGMADLVRADARLRFVGRVESLAPFYDAAHCVVCPLRIGGGIKVKMIEALRWGKAIVSTSVGTQGLTDADGGVLVHDDVAAFAEAVVQVLQDPELRRRLETDAPRVLRSVPRWADAADWLHACYQTILPRELRSTGAAAHS